MKDLNDFNGIKLPRYLKVVQPDRLNELAHLDRPLRVKVGFDPTTADLHLGHTVVLQAAKEFQDQGHQVTLVIGDFTALIGDPSGRDSTRPVLRAGKVRENGTAFIEQAFKVLDRDRTRVRFNSDWFGSLTAAKLINLMSQVTVNQMQARADFANRLANEWPIGLHEFTYPLLQAYDSVVLNTDVEIGGNDQLFNLLMGCDIQAAEGMPKQVTITVPLLYGFDVKRDPTTGERVGPKMSKTVGNHIAIGEGHTPLEMYNRVLLIRDDMIDPFAELLEPSLKDIASGRDLTIALAKSLVARFHGEAALEQVLADRASAAAGDAPEGTETKIVRVCGRAKLSYVLTRVCEVVTSKSDAKRIIDGGGVWLNGSKVTKDEELITDVTHTIRVGSKNRKFFRVSVVEEF